MKAHMPSWANNPDYTLHATTTKPEDGQRKTVFSIFDNQDDEAKAELQEAETNQSKDPNARGQPTTRL